MLGLNINLVTAELSLEYCHLFLWVSNWQGCRNGDSCSFSHDMGLPVSSYKSPTLCLPEDGEAKAAPLLGLFPTSSDGKILILDDTDMHYSSNFACHFDPSKILATTSLSQTSIFESTLDVVKIFWDLYHPFQTIISKEGKNPIPWNEVVCVLWFPNFGSFSEHIERQTVHLQNFFEYLAIRILADGLREVQVILTMNNIKFSQLEVII